MLSCHLLKANYGYHFDKISTKILNECDLKIVHKTNIVNLELSPINQNFQTYQLGKISSFTFILSNISDQ